MESYDVARSRMTALQTRFLCPFFFQRQRAHEGAQALLAARVTARDGHALALWECPGPHALYQEEVLDHVVAFLFPRDDTAGCRYLTLTEPVRSRWFGHLVARLSKDVTLPIRLVPTVGIELFLANDGVGMLSIALEPVSQDIAIAEAIEFNYRLSQLLWNNRGAFHIPHPSEDSQRWERLSPEAHQNIPPAPDPQEPVSERLGRPGGTFLPHELVDELLSPLTAFELRQVQERLSVYTVARCDTAVDFEQAAVRTLYAPLLSALVQVEEAGHAGAPTDTIGVSHALLNRRHWAGVGLLGAAHLVADQPEAHPFNEARVPRVFLKYFIPYLAAVLQRHTLHRIIDEAGAIVRIPSPDHAARLAALRTHLLTFAVGGHFTQVSTREALHHYYRLCQEGLDVSQALTTARQAISDLDAHYTTERQARVAEDTARNVTATREIQEGMQRLQHSMTMHLATVAHVQILVEYIEIFLVSVYAAHLWHMLEPCFHWVEWLRQGYGPIPKGEWDVLLVALVAGGIAAIFLRPWCHGRNSSGHKEM